MIQPVEPAAFVPLRSRARAALGAAWERATAAGTLPHVAAIERPAIEIERPANAEHGDLSSNLAMKLARPCRMAPLRIAEALAAELAADIGRPGSIVGAVTVAAPGFLNVRLADAALADVVGAVLAQPAMWGHVPAETPHRVNVEFVSANPTGPLHIGNARGAFVGDLLCRVLEAAGHSVTREYYFNDFGGPGPLDRRRHRYRAEVGRPPVARCARPHPVQRVAERSARCGGGRVSLVAPWHETAPGSPAVPSSQENGSPGA